MISASINNASVTSHSNHQYFVTVTELFLSLEIMKDSWCN